MENKIKVVEGMLNEFNRNEIEIRNIELEIADLEEITVNPISYTEKTSKTNKIQHPVEDEFISKNEKIKKLDFIKKNLERKNKKILNTMDVLKPKKREIIRFRYIDYVGNSWCFIAKEANVSEKWAMELKKDAIKEMAEIMFKHS